MTLSLSADVCVRVGSARVTLGGERDVPEQLLPPTGCQVLEGQEAWTGFLPVLCPWL